MIVKYYFIPSWWAILPLCILTKIIVSAVILAYSSVKKNHMSYVPKYFLNNLNRNCIKNESKLYSLCYMYSDYELKRQKACSIWLDLIYNIVYIVHTVMYTSMQVLIYTFCRRLNYLHYVRWRIYSNFESS